MMAPMGARNLNFLIYKSGLISLEKKLFLFNLIFMSIKQISFDIYNLPNNIVFSYNDKSG